jgi:hypothetical protein
MRFELEKKDYKKELEKKELSTRSVHKGTIIDGFTIYSPCCNLVPSRLTPTTVPTLTKPTGCTTS